MKYKKQGNLLIPRTFKQPKRKTPWFVTSVYIGVLILLSSLLILPLLSIILSK